MEHIHKHWHLHVLLDWFLHGHCLSIREDEKLQDLLSGVIVREKPNVKWEDVAGRCFSSFTSTANDFGSYIFQTIAFF